MPNLFSCQQSSMPATEIAGLQQVRDTKINAPAEDVQSRM